MMIPTSITPSGIFGMLRRGIMKLAQSYISRSAIIVIMICLAIWFVGPKLSYQAYYPLEPILHRVIAIAAVILLWGINNLIVMRREARTKKPAQTEVEKPLDPIDIEVAGLRRSFANAMTTIRDKWTGPERGTKSLYALPWFLVIGPPASGKTALITNADLKFPISHLFGLEIIKSIRATEKPDYWVTSDSVLFDLPGGWMQTEDVPIEDSKLIDPTRRRKEVLTREGRLWKAFMELLVQYRPRRPINGVVLCLDLPELLRSSDDERVNLASVIHSRLVELSEKLGTRFTVHIVINKLDKLAGFKEFFFLLPKSERTSPFGFSFTVNDVVNADSWQEEFSNQFKLFMERVNDDMIDRLYGQRDTPTRRSIYAFVRELAAIGPIISEFLKNALHSDKFSTPPMIRGLYFTSPRQEGVPFNALLSRIAQEHELPAPIMPAHAGLSQPHFTGELFQKIIFREAGLAGDNHVVERRKRFAFNSAVTASVLALLTFGFFLYQASQDNRARADNVVSMTRNYVGLPKTENASRDISVLVPPMNAIRAATDEYPGWREASESRRYLTLYEGRRVGPKVEEVYRDLLKERFLPTIATNLRDDIVRLGNDPKTNDSDLRLETLHSYLLLGDLGIRDELDANEETANQGSHFVKDWMMKTWQKRYEGNDLTQASLNQHLDYSLLQARLATPLDDEVVRKAQADLRRVPRDLRLYRNIESLAQRQNPTRESFQTVIGPSFDLVFKLDPPEPKRASVPFFFTKKGFLDFFIDQNKKLSVKALEDSWVTGEREKVIYSSEDLEAFRKKVRHRFATEYIDAWYNSANALEITDFQNIDHAVSVLGEINGPANPLGRMLGLIKVNTEIYDPKPVEVAADQAATAALKFDDDREQGLRINRTFTRLNDLTTAKEKEKPYMEELMAVLRQLEAYMREIKDGQASSKPIALERAKARADLKGDDPIYALRRISTNLPEPLNKQLAKIADETWKVVLDAAKRDLQVQWQEKVYRQFNMQLATRYPFRKMAAEDISIEEFEQFFGPSGAFESFFQQHLKTFVNENTGKPVVIDGRSIRVSDAFLTEIQKVRRIRNSFFDSKGAPSLRYTIEPVSLSQGMGRAVLNIEGQLVPYSNGPSRPIAILWPNALSSKQNVSQLSSFGGRTRDAASLTFQGIWSSFRLLDRATVSNLQPGSADVTFNAGAGRVLYRIRVEGQENPFVTTPLSSLKLPETL